MAKDMTVAQLERLLQKKRTNLDSLEQRRSRLQKKLKQLDSRIALIGGVVREGRKPRRGRKRPKNTQTLLQALSQVLTHNKKGLTLKELADKILEGGYKTASTKFQNTVYQVIYNNQDKVAHDAKTKTYRLK
ncbi:MAG: hypothetical protein EXS05_12070 [Planctomycetaceae bacterium]|nr:hypothetical protein [Planctomycetaceae bacterium]